MISGVKRHQAKLKKSITELAMLLIEDGNSVIVFGIAPRFDNLSNKSNEVNNRLVVIVGDRDISFLSHSKRINSSKLLNESE